MLKLFAGGINLPPNVKNKETDSGLSAALR
jgi:hypothetical protein